MELALFGTLALDDESSARVTVISRSPTAPSLRAPRPTPNVLRITADVAKTDSDCATEGSADAKRARELRSRALTLFATACGDGDASACAHVPPGMPKRSSGSVPLPLDAPRDAPKTATFEVEIHSGGDVVVDASTRTDELRTPKRCTKRTRVSIRADSRVSHGRVIAVVDALKKSGCAKIAFATRPAAP